MSDTIYAVGDIHGQKAMLEEALARIDADGGAAAKVVFLGDYTDRGPDSKGVIETLVQGMAAGRDWVFLKGNHDRMFEWCLLPDGPRHDSHMLIGYHWFHDKIGGLETAASYGVTFPERTRLKDVGAMMRAAVPDSHAAFLQALELSHQHGDLFFAHAGIRPGVALDQQTEEDLLWIRQEFHNDTRDHGALIVHGHTPVDRPMYYGNRVNLDTGAGYGRPLTTAVFEAGSCFVLGPNGRVRLGN